MESRVAIICCSFNLGKYIQPTVESILRQTEISKQIIIADAASSDNTLQILSKFDGVEVCSKPDSGYVEGFWNGVNLIKAKYLTQCAISDGYVDDQWLELACAYLDNNPHISLVWGSPISLMVDGVLGEMSYPKFGLRSIPESFVMRDFWKMTGFHFPEGNFVARKDVYLNCFPTLESYQGAVMEPFLEFTYKFHKENFQSVRIPRVANYGRIHEGQLTQQEVENDKKWLYQKRYQGQILSLLDEEFSKAIIFRNLNNLRVHFASYLGAKSRLLHALYMLEPKKVNKLLFALHIRLLTFIAKVFTPRVYRSFI